jgi:Flp pilus assembly protein TadD
MEPHPASSGPLDEARALLAQGRFEAAVGVLQPLASAGDAEALVLQSIGLRRAGRVRPALAAARQADQAMPSWGPALAALAASAAAVGRPGEANVAAQQALALAPGDPEVWNAAGLAAMAERDRAEAERCFRHGLTIDPAHAELAQNLARLAPAGPVGAGGPTAGMVAGAAPGEAGRRGGRFAGLLRRSLFVRVLPDDPDTEPVVLMAWAGIVVVAIGAFLFLLAAR